MNTTDNSETNHLTKTEGAARRTFSFRSECMADAESVRAMVLPWLLSWQANVEPLDLDGRLYRQPDVEVTFTLTAKAPGLACLRWLVDGLLNCHIAAETLETAEHYTGERASRRPWTGAVERPSQEVLLAATQALLDRQKLLEAELDRTRHMYRTLRAPYDLGVRWCPPTEEQGSPGWVAVVALPGTDVQRIVRITAAGGALKAGKTQSREMERRMLVING